MATNRTMKAMLASIETKKAEMMRLQAQIEALEEVYNLEAGIAPESSARAPRSDVKNLMLDLLEQVGADGLTAQKAKVLAEQSGKTLNPRSASSLLSRLAKDGVLHYDRVVYRLAKFAPKTIEPNTPTMPKMPDSVVRPLHSARSSGQGHSGF